MEYLNSLSGEELVLLASTVSIAIASNLETDELAVLSAFATAVGDNLALIAAKRI